MLVEVGHEFLPYLPALFIQVLPLLIFCNRGHTELDSNQAKFSIGYTDFILNYCILNFMGMSKPSENLSGVLGHFPSHCYSILSPLLALG